MQALVIDDSRTVRAIIGRILEELGMEVFHAGNGREGLERLRAELAGLEARLSRLGEGRLEREAG